MRTSSVLIVEDDPAVRLALEIIVRSAGYALAGSAATGEQGIRLAEAHMPLLALVDIGLPGALNGFEAARRIREHCGAFIVFVISASQDAFRERTSELAADYIRKPCHERDICRALWRFLGPPAQV